MNFNKFSEYDIIEQNKGGRYLDLIKKFPNFAYSNLKNYQYSMYQKSYLKWKECYYESSNSATESLLSLAGTKVTQK